MNPFFKMSKFILLMLLFTQLLAGCYEGSKHSGGSDSGSPSGKPGGESKPYGLVILDVIRPSEDALVDPQCGAVPASLVEIRKNEMDARVDSLKSLLGAAAEVVKINVTFVLPSDCKTLQAVYDRATNELPLDIDADALNSRPALHIRLVLWYGDFSTNSPRRAIRNSEWADGGHLSRLGFDTLFNINHFVLTSAPRGFMWAWQKNSREENNFAASVVIDPLPTNEGLKQLADAVQNSTIAFGRFLRVRTSQNP